VLVKYTYYGDANLDGQVDGSDYTKIDNGFNNHLTGWINGDFNYDGAVDGSDYTLIDNAFNTQSASIAASIASADVMTNDSAARLQKPAAKPVATGSHSTAAIRKITVTSQSPAVLFSGTVFRTGTPVVFSDPNDTADELLTQKTDVVDALSAAQSQGR
jgi:hypothetical protein